MNSSPQINWPRSVLVSFESNMIKTNKHAFTVFGGTIIFLSSHVITWKNVAFPTALGTEPGAHAARPRVPCPRARPVRCLREDGGGGGWLRASSLPRFGEPEPTPCTTLSRRAESPRLQALRSLCRPVGSSSSSSAWTLTSCTVGPAFSLTLFLRRHRP